MRYILLMSISCCHVMSAVGKLVRYGELSYEANVWLHSSVGRASQRYRGGHRLLLSN